MRPAYRTALPSLVFTLCVGGSAFGQETGGATPEQAAAGEPVTRPADADEAKEAQIPSPKSDWRTELTMWVWVMSLTGEVGARGESATVDAGFQDIVDKSDSMFGFSGRVEVGYKRFGAYFDGLYTEIAVEDQTGPAGLADIDGDLTQVTIDFGAMYRLGEWELSGSAAKNPRPRTLDLYGGGRFNALELELRPATRPSRSADESWTDPVVGLKATLPISEHWHATLNGDVGGFGVASDFTWSGTAVIGYDFHLFSAPASVMFGYRAIGWDYSEGAGSEEFRWDVIQHGIILGFNVKF